MKNLIASIFLLTLTSMVQVNLQAQSDFPKIIENPIYEPITDPDLEYVFDSLPTIPSEPNEGAVIVLNFRHPYFNSNRINFSVSSLTLKNNDIENERLLIKPYVIKEGDASVSGSRTWDDETLLKVKYLKENGEPFATIIEVSNVFYKNYPQYRYAYQAHFYKDGGITVQYGPNNFLPDMPLYADIAAEILLFRDEELPAYFIVTESPLNPIVFNHFTHPNITLEFVQDSVNAFSYFPDEVLAYSFNIQDAVTSVNNLPSTSNDYGISSTKGYLVLDPKKNEGLYSVRVFGLDGQLILEEDNLLAQQKLRVKSTAKMVLVRISDQSGIQVKKLLMN